MRINRRFKPYQIEDIFVGDLGIGSHMIGSHTHAGTHRAITAQCFWYPSNSAALQSYHHPTVPSLPTRITWGMPVWNHCGKILIG